MNGFERAVSSFKEGFSCSQALLSIYGTQLRLTNNYDYLLFKKYTVVLCIELFCFSFP